MDNVQNCEIYINVLLPQSIDPNREDGQIKGMWKHYLRYKGGR
jgi:hypothetical protein